MTVVGQIGENYRTIACAFDDKSIQLGIVRVYPKGSLDLGLYSAGFGRYLWQVWSISG
jgi:hypothetical protein